MTTYAIKKPSGFMHAAARTGLRAAFAAYDFVRKHPRVTSTATLGLVVGVFASVASGDIDFGLTAAKGAAALWGLIEAIGYGASLVRTPSRLVSSEKNLRAVEKFVESYQRSHREENLWIKELLNEGAYREAMAMKREQEFPARSKAALVREYYGVLAS